MKGIKALSAAERDLAAAIAYYESCSYQVAKKFLSSYRRTLRLIQDQPNAGRMVAGEVRRWLLRGFPHAIAYKVGETSIIVVAIIDLRREPDYWHSRV
ncbi:MAG: type II toxin-antitoxin system RelE/ParE family toxin [Candidatus Hydrogenedentes bacterium]|nr:type II toxin-antitoxin system RelE/ParE family toxin [Candidatus Hydrogenedentota bacterium]